MYSEVHWIKVLVGTSNGDVHFAGGWAQCYALKYSDYLLWVEVGYTCSGGAEYL